jgi:hypothetical protein
MPGFPTVRKLARFFLPGKVEQFMGDENDQFATLCEMMRTSAGMELKFVKTLYFWYIYEVHCWEIKNSGKDDAQIAEELEEEHEDHRLRCEVLVHLAT